MTTSQSARLALQGEVKRGNTNAAPEALPHGGGEASTDRPGFFTDERHRALDLNELHAFELLASAVVLLDAQARIVFANAQAEALLDLSARQLEHQDFLSFFSVSSVLDQSLQQALQKEFAHKRLIVQLERLGREPLKVQATVVALFGQRWPLLVELIEVDQQLRIEREQQLIEQAEANRQLLRNLAHEIKNPLGGVRGAAQLLELELNNPGLSEYTQVIIQEADRLQVLVDRLLAPHRSPRVIEEMNIHEVCERVRALVLAEYPKGLTIIQDYDAAIPEFMADKAQLIQAVLNIVRNAAEALTEQIRHDSGATIRLRTRVARQITIGRQRHRLVLDLQIHDNGPGVAPEILDRIFHPLVSGRDGGSGLGLSLAQSFVQQHQGMIECDSRTGHTVFRILLPLP